MGKIKGWKKSIDNDVKYQYNSFNPILWHPTNLYSDIYYIILDRPEHLNGKFRTVILYKLKKDVIDRHFTTKEKSFAFAIKYMRSHPNG